MVENKIRNEEQAGEPPAEMTREEEVVAFEKFLDYLAPNREEAGARYEKLRRAAIRYFIRYHAPDPEACADETLRRLQQLIAAGRAIHHIEYFIIGVARKVQLQDRMRRQQREVELPEGESENPGASPLKQLEEQFERKCWAECWQALSDEERDLLDQYGLGSQHDKESREALAARCGLTRGNLRRKVHGVKKKLRECFNERLKKGLRKT
jgi:DNA-directed RNA polymerase specialized sigma24 family protein